MPKIMVSIFLTSMKATVFETHGISWPKSALGHEIDLNFVNYIVKRLFSYAGSTYRAFICIFVGQISDIMKVKS